MLNSRVGMDASHRRPIGYASSWAVDLAMLIDGLRSVKRVFKPQPTMEKVMPITHILKVRACCPA